MFKMCLEESWNLRSARGAGGPMVPAQMGESLVQFPVASQRSISAPIRTNPSSQEKVHVEL